MYYILAQGTWHRDKLDDFVNTFCKDKSVAYLAQREVGWFLCEQFVQVQKCISAENFAPLLEVIGKIVERVQILEAEACKHPAT